MGCSNCKEEKNQEERLSMIGSISHRTKTMTNFPEYEDLDTLSEFTVKESTNIDRVAVDLDNLDPDLMVESDVYKWFSGSPSDPIRTLDNLPEGFDHEREVEGLYNPVQMIVDGFTPGAVKNILSMDGKDLKVFSVTENSIKFLTESQLFFADDAWRFEDTTLLFNLKSCSLFFFFDDRNQSPKVVKLSRKSGKLESVKNLDFSIIMRFAGYCLSPKIGLVDVPIAKNLIFGYVAECEEEAEYEDELEYEEKDEKRINMHLFRLFKGQLRPWMPLSTLPGLAEKYKKSRENGSDIDLRYNISSHPEHTGHFQTRAFTCSRVTSLVMLYTQKSITLKAVDIKSKKVLNSRRMKIADFIPGEELFRNVKDLEDRDYGDTDNPDSILNQFMICPYGVCRDTRRLLIQLRGSWTSLLVTHRVECLFGSITNGMVVEKEFRRDDDTYFIKPIEGEKLLAASRALDDDQKEHKTPVWLDPKTLEEEKLFDVDKRPELGAVIQTVGAQNHALPTKIGENLILFVSHRDFTLFNFKEDKIVFQLRHAPEMNHSFDVKLTTIENRTFWTCSDSLYCVEVTEGESWKRAESFQRLNLLDHLPKAQGLILVKDYSLVKMESGNLLYIGARSVEDSIKKPEDPAKVPAKILQGLSMEICSKTLKVLNTWRMGEEQDEYTEENINVKEFYSVGGDLLISGIKETKKSHKDSVPNQGDFDEEMADWFLEEIEIVEKNQNKEKGDVAYGLALWDKKLNLLQTNFEVGVRDLESILTVVQKHVTARGPENNFLLFEVDVQAKKISLEKNLSIQADSISDVPKQVEDPKEFICEVKGLDRDKKILLRFNSQLELLSWTENYRREAINGLAKNTAF